MKKTGTLRRASGPRAAANGRTSGTRVSFSSVRSLAGVVPSRTASGPYGSLVRWVFAIATAWRGPTSTQAWRCCGSCPLIEYGTRSRPVLTPIPESNSGKREMR